MTDILFELGDIAILIALWLILGGDLAVVAFVAYAAAGLGLDLLRKQRSPVAT